MADPGIACILFEDDDAEARIARMCPEVLWLPCACSEDCGHGTTLGCVKDKHDASDPHRDIDGIEWRQVDGA